jgi:hypothetical protein
MDGKPASAFHAAVRQLAERATLVLEISVEHSQEPPCLFGGGKFFLPFGRN